MVLDASIWFAFFVLPDRRSYINTLLMGDVKSYMGNQCVEVYLD